MYISHFDISCFKPILAKHGGVGTELKNTSKIADIMPLLTSFYTTTRHGKRQQKIYTSKVWAKSV